MPEVANALLRGEGFTMARVAKLNFESHDVRACLHANVTPFAQDFCSMFTIIRRSSNSRRK